LKLAPFPTRNRYFFFLDTVLLPLMAFLSFLVRLDDLPQGNTLLGWFILTTIATPVHLIVFRCFGIYSRYWRYASIDELLLLISAISLAMIISTPVAFIVAGMTPMALLPRSVPVIFFCFGLAATIAPFVGPHSLASCNPQTEIVVRAERSIAAGLDHGCWFGRYDDRPRTA